MSQTDKIEKLSSSAILMGAYHDLCNNLERKAKLKAEIKRWEQMAINDVVDMLDCPIYQKRWWYVFNIRIK